MGKMGPFTPCVRLRLLCCTLLTATLVNHVASEKNNIVKLTKFNFDSNVRSGHWFVKFFAPWCTHCQRLAPIWEKLADHAASADWPVKIAEVDCTSNKEVCEKIQVKAFPTLALISNGAVKGKYKGEASVAQFQDWLNNQKVLKAGAAEGQTITQEANTPKPTASHSDAASAVLSNFLARFPTRNEILNIYIYAFVVLALLVISLCAVFRMVDKEEVAEEHEKEG